MIKTRDDLKNYFVRLPYPVVLTEGSIKLFNVSKDAMIIDFFIIIDNTMRVEAYKGSTVVNIRHLFDGFTWKLTLFSQIERILSYLNTLSINVQNDISHIGKYFLEIINTSEDIDEKKRKQLDNIYS